MSESNVDQVHSNPKFQALLTGVRAGNTKAEEQLFAAVYSDLRRVAAAVFTEQSPGHTLQPTALVHEVWLKLSGGIGKVEDRHHFFALAARAMRQILTDHARSESRQKRGGDWRRITLSGKPIDAPAEDINLADLHEALARFELIDARAAEVARLRILGTLEVAEVADVLNLSERTVARDWSVAKLWLRRELRDG